MFDLQKFLALIQGGLLNPRETWQKYLAEGHDWKSTALLLTIPLVVGCAIISAVLGWLFHSGMFAFGRGFFAVLIMGLIYAAIGIVLVSFVFSFLAGVFKGEHNFDRGFAAISLTAIPAQLGSIVSTIPWIGWLVGLAASILSLVYLYQIIPSYLKVPDNQRIIHYILSIAATIIIMIVLSFVLGIGGMMGGMGMSGTSKMGMSSSSSSGKLSGLPFGQQADLVAATSEDKYDPPKDGKVSEAQAQAYARFMAKTADYRQSQMERLQKIEKEAKDSGNKSPSLSQISGGLGSVMGMSFAEMEVVHTGGGNWAEHQWIKQQMRTASIQKDINDAVKHNYELYKKYIEPVQK